MQFNLRASPRAGLAALAICTLACGSSVAQTADSFPRKNIRIVVPFAAGGAADILARTLIQHAATATGWQFYVENITGAGGLVGAQAAARSASDGYTLLLCNVACAANQFMTQNTGWNPKAAIAPVIVVGNLPNILVVGPSLSANSLANFLMLARARPGQLSMASSGPGSSSYLTAELLKVKAGVDIIDVPYRGSAAAMPDLIAGRVDGMVMGIPESLPFIRDGKLKPLGVTSDERAPSLPNVPTIAEAGVPGYSFLGWLSLFVPQKTPANIVAILNAGLDKAIKSSAVAQRFAELSIRPVGGSAALAGRLLNKDIDLWGPLLQSRKARDGASAPR
ncbi:MAG: tripartite tricarboxylate transporter substrate binding protein [Rhizobiales bacterium]|nr:tripartite tricarboxylate transporter substrate binding protein [Hyphomicrobiales bacterium]